MSSFTIINGPEVQVMGVGRIIGASDDDFEGIVNKAVSSGGIQNNGLDEVLIKQGKDILIAYGKGLPVNELRHGMALSLFGKSATVIRVMPEPNTAWEGVKDGWGGLLAAGAGAVVGGCAYRMLFKSGVFAGFGIALYPVTGLAGLIIGYLAAYAGAITVLGGLGYTGYTAYQGAAVRADPTAIEKITEPMQ